jgi:predicted outer membrane repeat protein
MHRKSLLLTCILAVLALSGLASSAALACRVTNTSKNPVASFGTLQEGVNEAAAGDTLRVTGSCEGNTTIARSLRIVGFLATLKGSGGGSVVIIEPGATVTISGVTITGGTGTERHGFAPAGGGIFSEGSLTLEYSIVSGNSATYGGGIENLYGLLTLNHSIVSGNSAPVGGGIENFLGSLTLEHSIVSGNSAVVGGGIYNFLASLEILNGSTVNRNKAEESGGGIYVDGYKDLNVMLENSRVNRNEADYGGGILLSEPGVLTLAGSAVNSNKADYGGGILLEERGSLRLEGPTFVEGNKATEQGGGILRESSADIIYEEPDWTGAITGNEPNNIFTEIPILAPEFTIETLQKIKGAGPFTTSKLTGHVGQTVKYEIIVKNTGNVSLEFSNFMDANCSTETPIEGTLKPGYFFTYKCSHRLTSTGTYSNEATIEANEGTPPQKTSNKVEVEVSEKA